MDQELITEQIEELRSRQHIQSIKIISSNCFHVAYSPHGTNSPYSHIVFNIKVVLPEKYPEVPPVLAFLDKVYHLNIDPISGNVLMSLLKEDWSPYITLSSVFDFLDSLLEQPDPNYAASESLKFQFCSDPEKYATKVNQMINICTSEAKEHANQSVVQHVEEIVEYNKSAEGNLFNNSIEKIEHEDAQIHLKQSIPFSEIPKNQPESYESPIIEKNNSIKVEQPPQKKIQEPARVQKPKVESKVSKPILIDVPNEKNIGDSFNVLKQSLSKKQYQSPQKKEDFDEIQLSLRKTDQLMQLLLQGCESMQNTVNNSHNQRIKQLLEKKLQYQWKMVEQLLDLSSRLKEKLFNDLRNQTKQLLK